MQCKICNHTSEKKFEKILLQHYKTGFCKCTNCSFMQTDEPIWLEQAYQSAINSLGIKKRITCSFDKKSLLAPDYQYV